MADGKGNNKTFERWRQLVQATVRLDPWRRRRMAGKEPLYSCLNAWHSPSPHFLCCQRVNRYSSSYVIPHSTATCFGLSQLEFDIRQTAQLSVVPFTCHSIRSSAHEIRSILYIQYGHTLTAIPANLVVNDLLYPGRP